MSNSGRLAAMIRATDPGRAAAVVPVPDPELVRPGDVVATADAAVLDRCGAWAYRARAVVDAGVPGVVDAGVPGAVVVDLG